MKFISSYLLLQTLALDIYKTAINVLCYTVFTLEQKKGRALKLKKGTLSPKKGTLSSKRGTLSPKKGTLSPKKGTFSAKRAHCLKNGTLPGK